MERTFAFFRDMVSSQFLQNMRNLVLEGSDGFWVQFFQQSSSQDILLQDSQ